mmetsp:Transcript_34256/g.80249  ORF Transcript_34256/g.80249 Transcript_34256/m.80249 type:complete len:251 (+) Transcript_34256:702-1454(+)
MRLRSRRPLLRRRCTQLLAQQLPLRWLPPPPALAPLQALPLQAHPPPPRASMSLCRVRVRLSPLRACSQRGARRGLVRTRRAGPPSSGSRSRRSCTGPCAARRRRSPTRRRFGSRSPSSRPPTSSSGRKKCSLTSAAHTVCWAASFSPTEGRSGSLCSTSSSQPPLLTWSLRCFLSGEAAVWAHRAVARHAPITPAVLWPEARQLKRSSTQRRTPSSTCAATSARLWRACWQAPAIRRTSGSSRVMRAII